MARQSMTLWSSVLLSALGVTIAGCSSSDDTGTGGGGAAASGGTGGVGGSGGSVGGAAGSGAAGAAEHAWSKKFGDSAPQRAGDLAVDDADNVIVVGHFLGVVDLGGGPLTSAGGQQGGDVFVGKLDADGNHLWSKGFGDDADQGPVACVADPTSNVIVSGMFGGTLDFGGGTLTSAGGPLVDSDLFLVKFDSDGNHLWSTRYGDGDDEVGSALAVDGSGNIALVGYFAGTIDFGGGTLTSTGGSDLWEGADIFVAKLDPDGNHIWSQRFGDAAEQFGTGVAIDLSGNVVIAGDFDGDVDFGGGVLTSAGDGFYGGDIFVAKLDPDGNHLWSKRFGDGESQAVRGVAVDGAGNIVLIGSFQGEVDFGGGPLTCDSLHDAFVLKLDASGEHLWSGRFGGPGRQSATSVDIDTAGQITIVGTFDETAEYDGHGLTSAGGDAHGDVFVLQVGADGAHHYSRAFGDEADEYVTGVAADSTSAIVLAGWFEGDINFGGNTLVDDGHGSVFLAKLAP